MRAATISPAELRPIDSALDARDDLVLAASATLHANGEETSETLAAAARLADALGLRAPSPGALGPGAHAGRSPLSATWGQLFLSLDGDRVRATVAVPSDVNMRRVVGTHHAVDAIAAAARAGRLDAASAEAALATAAHAPTSPLWLFTLACAGGAAALAVINGASHALVLGVVALAAGAGALVRRGLAARGANVFVQLFAATLLAGVVGAAGVRAGISSDLRLVGLGPLLVLVPGPSFLNATFDLAALRLSLGGARLAYALLTVLTLSAGVLIGFGLGGVSVPPAPASHPVTFWADAACAGVAAAAYGVFFAMPYRPILYPVLAGMAAHAVRWAALSVFHFGNATGAGFACLVAGAVMVPVARRRQLPFAAVGFAAVVSMVPGSFLFRMCGGLVQIQTAKGDAPVALLSAVLADFTTAVMTLGAMALGLLAPMRLYDHLRRPETGQTP